MVFHDFEKSNASWSNNVSIERFYTKFFAIDHIGLVLRHFMNLFSIHHIKPINIFDWNYCTVTVACIVKYYYMLAWCFGLDSCLISQPRLDICKAMKAEVIGLKQRAHELWMKDISNIKIV